MMFLYWGRRGALTKFSLDLAAAAKVKPEIPVHFSISRQSENFSAFAKLGVSLHAVDTFEASSGALTQLWRLPAIRNALGSYITTNDIGTVIDLMPHVWSPLIVSAIRSAGARYIATAHDAAAHPGDRTALVKGWIDRTLGMADEVITLSASVTAALSKIGKVPVTRMTTLFHPNMTYGVPVDRSSALEDRPLRFLFLGRIMPYKGLRLFVAAAEALRASGLPVEIGVFGAGDLEGLGERLRLLGAQIVNRWLTDREIAEALARYDVMVVSHIEASQSGVVATAFGAGMPVICTPVGALNEQVTDGVNGLVAHEVTGPALAAIMRRMAEDRQLYVDLHQAIRAQACEQSMTQFLAACASLDSPRRQP